MMLYYTHSWLHLSLGTAERFLRWAVVAFITSVLLFVIGLRFGSMGVAGAYSASFYLLTAPALWYAGRPIGLKVSTVVAAVWKYFVSALGAGSVCWFLATDAGVLSRGFLNSNVVARIVVSGAACTSIYLVLIVVLYQGVTPIAQFMDVLRDMLPSLPSRERYPTA